MGGEEDQAIAGLLHDAPEDAGGRPKAGSDPGLFGDVVAEIVERGTDAVQQPKPPWPARDEAYLATIRKKPAATLLVSVCCDKLDDAWATVADLR